MNKQKAIEILNDFDKCVKVKSDGAYPTKDYIYAVNIAISALEQQLTNGWISCKEKLPYRLDEVVTCSKDGVITIGYIRKREGYYVCEHLPFVTEDIVAWMPLPLRYEEVSHE